MVSEILKVLLLLVISVNVFAGSAIPSNSDYRLYNFGTRYGFLFDNNGNPVVIFDYSLAPLGWKDYSLGTLTIPEFRKLQFQENWIRQKERGARFSKTSSRTGFSPESFNLGDIFIDKREQDKVYESMSRFSLLVLRSILKKSDLKEFLMQFELKWSASKKVFNLTWKPSMTLQKSSFVGPGWVANYVDPLDIRTYKNKLRASAEDFARLDVGIIGTLMSEFVSRIDIGLVARMNAHENQLIDKLEELLREKPELSMPLENIEEFLTGAISLASKSRVSLDVDYEEDGFYERGREEGGGSDVFGIPRRFESAMIKTNRQLAQGLASSGTKDFHYLTVISDLIDKADLDYTH